MDQSKRRSTSGGFCKHKQLVSWPLTLLANLKQEVRLHGWETERHPRFIQSAVSKRCWTQLAVFHSCALLRDDQNHHDGHLPFPLNRPVPSFVKRDDSLRWYFCLFCVWVDTSLHDNHRCDFNCWRYARSRGPQSNLPPSCIHWFVTSKCLNLQIRWTDFGKKLQPFRLKRSWARTNKSR